jgi:hypothetical protein
MISMTHNPCPPLTKREGKSSKSTKMGAEPQVRGERQQKNATLHSRQGKIFPERKYRENVEKITLFYVANK